MSEVLIDTSFAIALSVSNDLHHQRAVKLAEQFEANGTQLIITRAIILEIGNALAGLHYRKAAARLIEALANDPKIEIVPVTEDLCARAFELFKQRQDKEWGLIDCISFTVMKDRQLTAALTADNHFLQAGFRALLKED